MNSSEAVTSLTILRQYSPPTKVPVVVCCQPMIVGLRVRNGSKKIDVPMASRHLLLELELSIKCLAFILLQLASIPGSIGQVLEATGNELRHTLSGVMLLFVVPLTVITLAISAWRCRRPAS